MDTAAIFDGGVRYHFNDAHNLLSKMSVARAAVKPGLYYHVLELFRRVGQLYNISLSFFAVPNDRGCARARGGRE